MMKTDKAMESVFWGRVDASGECWIWEGKYLNRTCYFRYRGKNFLANRVAYELTFGAISTGLYVIRKCGNDRCVKPDHLVTGTHRDMMAIMRKNGHIRSGLEKSLMTVTASGINHWKVKSIPLTPDDVRTIRREWEERGKSQVELGREYGVTPSYISKIVHRIVLRDIE